MGTVDALVMLSVVIFGFGGVFGSWHFLSGSQRQKTGTLIYWVMLFALTCLACLLWPEETATVALDGAMSALLAMSVGMLFVSAFCAKRF